jgi:hypothetical protein
MFNEVKLKYLFYNAILKYDENQESLFASLVWMQDIRNLERTLYEECLIMQHSNKIEKFLNCYLTKFYCSSC